MTDNSGLSPWEFGRKRLQEAIHCVEQVEVEPGSEWKVEYLGSLLGRRLQAHYDNQTVEEERPNKLVYCLTM